MSPAHRPARSRRLPAGLLSLALLSLALLAATALTPAHAQPATTAAGPASSVPGNASAPSWTASLAMTPRTPAAAACAAPRSR